MPTAMESKFSFRLTETHRDQLEEYAISLDQTLSALIRQIIEAFIAKQKSRWTILRPAIKINKQIVG